MGFGGEMMLTELRGGRKSPSPTCHMPLDDLFDGGGRQTSSRASTM